MRFLLFLLPLLGVRDPGRPLWHSRVLERPTGTPTDPQYNGRDILRESIEEAKAVGLTVMPWLEYGFFGGWSSRRA